MTTTANQYAAVEATRTIGTTGNMTQLGPGIVAGNRQNPTVLSFANDQVYEAGFTILNTSEDDFNSDIIWNTGNGGVDTFSYFWLIADQNALVELRNTNSDAVVLSLFAGVPLLLGADEMLDGTLGADGSATILPNVIDQITVKNNTTGASANTTVTGRLLLFN